jgi:hypothetical protein
MELQTVVEDIQPAAFLGIPDVTRYKEPETLSTKGYISGGTLHLTYHLI